ncbi:MAG: hypothetical protein JXR76_13680 [Deltaproteobacteria bacterium]|nr:hypothetical protein [Deltaproteobacteria bacterium]
MRKRFYSASLLSRIEVIFNLFNTGAVVGIAGSNHPFNGNAETLIRDVIVMDMLTHCIEMGP